MKRQAYKRNLFFVLSMLLSPVFAQTDALSVDVPNLSSYADTEATTNIFFNGGDTDDRIFRLSLELNAASDNNVSILFGTDANANGVLDREEADAVVGWDSGSWFYRDRVNGVESQAVRSEGRRRLNWELTMNPRKAVKSIEATDADGVVFTGALEDSMFNPDWNLIQVTARGLAESGGIVVNQVLGRGLKVILR